MTVKYVTPGGKEIMFVNKPNAVIIKFASGGELPEELSGEFTSVTFAEKAVQIYLARQEIKASRGPRKQ